jgi:LysW-gamma-L-lysine carboxypeptidase
MSSPFTPPGLSSESGLSGKRDISPTLLGLLQLYSPSGEERHAVNFLVSRMQALGFTQAFIDQAGNAVGLMGDGPQQIVLLGHIDTVPGEVPVRVVGEIEAGDALPETEQLDVPQPAAASPSAPVLFGRGAVDAKGSLAAFVDAVAEAGVLPGWQVVVIGAVEEERDSQGARYVRSQYAPDYAIIGEPSGWDRITLAYKGSAWAEIEVHLAQAHTAAQRPSASEAAIEVWNAILSTCRLLNQSRQRLFDEVSPTLRSFISGEDGFDAWARMNIAVRLPPDLPPDAWYSQLEGIPSTFSAYQVSVHRTGYAIPAYVAQKNTPLVRAMLASIRLAGGQPGFVRKTGTADLNIVAPVWACPAVAYGPGDSSLDHTPHEHIQLAEYARARSVLVATLRTLCRKQPVEET